MYLLSPLTKLNITKIVHSDTMTKVKHYIPSPEPSSGTYKFWYNMLGKFTFASLKAMKGFLRSQGAKTVKLSTEK